VYRTEIRIRQYKNCCIPQVCYVSTTTRRVNEKIVRIVGTTATRGGRSVSTASAEKNLLGFRARASRIRGLASGRGGPRYCGGQQSGLKKRLSSPSDVDVDVDVGDRTGDRDSGRGEWRRVAGGLWLGVGRYMACGVWRGHMCSRKAQTRSTTTEPGELALATTHKRHSMYPLQVQSPEQRAGARRCPPPSPHGYPTSHTSWI
jgi:hypothetical protein